MRLPVRIVTLVLLSLGLSGCARHKAPKGGDLSWREPARLDEWTQTFFQAGYGLCDAQVLARFWRIRPPDAKARAGMEIERSDLKSFESGALDQARQRALAAGDVRCSYAEAGFSDADIGMLAGYWELSFDEAARMVEDKLVWGGGWLAWEAVKAASGYKGYDEGYVEDDGTEGLKAFFNSGLHYCDARWLSVAWGMDITQAKITWGNKVTWFSEDPAYVQSVRDEVRVQALAQGSPACEWVETSFSYNDAEALACTWGTSVEQAKATIAQKVTDGTEDLVRQALATARCP